MIDSAIVRGGDIVVCVSLTEKITRVNISYTTLFPNNVVRQWPRRRPRYYCKNRLQKNTVVVVIIGRRGKHGRAIVVRGEYPCGGTKKRNLSGYRSPRRLTDRTRRGDDDIVCYTTFSSRYIIITIVTVYVRRGRASDTTGRDATRQCFLPRFTSERVVTRHGHTHTHRGGRGGKQRRGRDRCRRRIKARRPTRNQFALVFAHLSTGIRGV